MAQEINNTIKELTESLRNDIKICQDSLDAPVIVRHNYVVVSKSREYTMGVEDNHTKVCFGLTASPVCFTKEVAEMIVAHDKVENGRGKVEFEAMGRRAYLRMVMEKKQGLLNSLEELITR